MDIILKVVWRYGVIQKVCGICPWGIRFFLQEEESFWRVLVLLEKPYEEVREKLRGGFCYLNVVLAGLDSESDYWIGLALSWIEQGGAEASDVLLARLKRVVEGRSANQKNRHKAFSVLRKIGG
ncbi:hypothetical protein ACSEUM_04395 [Pseudomonas aeruginosa]